jgi:hypothetical protein
MQPRFNSTMQSLHIYAEFVTNACGIASFVVSWMPLAFKVSHLAISSLALGENGGEMMLLLGHRGFWPVISLDAMH